MHHLSIDLARAKDAERISGRLPASLRLGGGLRAWARTERTYAAPTATFRSATRRRNVNSM